MSKILREYDFGKIMGVIRIPKMEQFCPDEYIFYKESKIFYMLYKTNDDTYPDVAKITKSIYGKNVLEYYQGSDTANSIERFRDFNIGKEEILAQLIEELSIKDIGYKRVEELFEKHKDILEPICSLLKLCYYWPILCIALEKRVYKGRPTVIKSSLVVRDIVAFARRQITKEELFKRWPEILERIEIGTTITNVKYIPVKGHEKDLKSERFKYKKGETISVRPYGKLLIDKV